MPRRKQTVPDARGQVSHADGLAETMSAVGSASPAVKQATSTSPNGSVSRTHSNGRPLTSTTQPLASAGTENAAQPGNSLSAIEGQEVRRRKPAPSEDPAVLDAPFSSRSMEAPKPSQRHSWLLLALASGTFAALNGAFAKLTTASNTSALTSTLAAILHVSSTDSNTWYRVLDIVIRALFFGLNLVSNGIMWALFTRALTAHESATSVSILNTSANFLVTAAIGALGFSEKLPAKWFLGAGFLLVGSVVIGRNAKEDSLNDGQRGERVVVGDGERDGEAVSLLDVDAREEVR